MTSSPRLLSCSGLPWSLAEVKVSPSLLPSTWFKAVGSVAAELPLSLASRATSSATAVPAHTLLLLNPLPLTLLLLALVCAEPALPAQLSILARSLLISTSGTLFSILLHSLCASCTCVCRARPACPTINSRPITFDFHFRHSLLEHLQPLSTIHLIPLPSSQLTSLCRSHARARPACPEEATPRNVCKALHFGGQQVSAVAVT